MTRSAARNLQAVRRLDGEGGGRARLWRTRSQAEQDPDARAFVRCDCILLDRIWRLVVEGETIPHREKFFSVFEQCTRRISKGKAGCIAELGLPATVVQDRHGFVLASKLNWTGTDKECAVPIILEAQKCFPGIEAASFDRGFAARRTGPRSTSCSSSTRFRRKAA